MSTQIRKEKPKNPTPGSLPAALAGNVAALIPQGSLICQFQSPDGTLGANMNIPSNITPELLEILLNELLNNEEKQPYTFYVDDEEITTSLHSDVIEKLGKSPEEIIQIRYQPLAMFKVKPVTRCSSSLEGHTEAVLSCHFSPDGKQLATGSGDTTIRLWDLSTETPMAVLRGHTNWVEVVAWSPDGKLLASGGMDNSVRLWDPVQGKQLGELKGHRQCITSIAWEPMSLNAACNRFATASKDGMVRVWDATRRQMIFGLGGHTAPVMCVRWGTSGLIYTASRDKTIKVWDGKDGKLVRTLEGHAHWVNHLACNTDHLTRSGCFDERRKVLGDRHEAQSYALERVEKWKTVGKVERLVSCSDDFTMFLWEPTESKKPIARMTGHQQPITHVSFSPNGQFIASASFDKSVKLWDGLTGKFITTLRGHVGPVYQVCFSADSRLLLSSSKDSTCKLWDLRTKSLKLDLPGHADEVYTVDWAPGRGEYAASGGKDRLVKIMPVRPRLTLEIPQVRPAQPIQTHQSLQFESHNDENLHGSMSLTPTTMIANSVETDGHEVIHKWPPTKAVWIGNVGEEVTEQDLRALFKDVDVQSVAFVRKSRCAFVNVASQEQVERAAKLYHDAIVKGAHLVVRARRMPEDKTREPSPQITRSVSPIYTAEEELEIRKLFDPPVFHAYFIQRALTEESLLQSISTNSWTVGQRQISTLNEAFVAFDNVWLIFFVGNKVFGYARMEQMIEHAPTERFSMDSLRKNLPELGNTPSASPLSPFNPLLTDLTSLNPGLVLSAPFRVRWIVTEAGMPVTCLDDIRNMLEGGMIVRRCHDGSQLETRAGEFVTSRTIAWMKYRQMLERNQQPREPPRTPQQLPMEFSRRFGHEIYGSPIVASPMMQRVPQNTPTDALFSLKSDFEYELQKNLEDLIVSRPGSPVKQDSSKTL